MANKKEEKLKLINALYKDFLESAERYSNLINNDDWWETIGNKNFGKTALKRKAVYLRQEIKNFCDMLIE